MAQRGTISLDQIRGAPAGGFAQSLAATGGKFIEAFDATTGLFTARVPTEADLSLSDITTNNVSTSKHGLAPKAPNDATKYLDGTGAWSVPAGGGGGGGGLAGSIVPVSVTSPSSSGWSWDNQGSSTSDFAHGYMHLETNRSGATSIRMFYRTAPSTPYTATFFLRASIAKPGESSVTGARSGAGVGFRDSGGKIIAFYLLTFDSTWQINVTKYNSSTSFSANYYNYQAAAGADPTIGMWSGIWLRITNDGTNLVFKWSLDGDYWIQVDSRGRTDFMASGPNAYGVLAYVEGDGPTVNVLSLVES